ncbi:IS4 family transposase [Verminephrobacter eiseniae]|uniref:Transposase, IS4 family n=3 Tax=Verminephrobacter eiseniae TaxID=364317 RepID=A1WMI1_VEREI|nr:transposase, IS4 family [Verminephrobacter eiseniae EF01-2]
MERMSWAQEEFADLDLGDKRLNRRQVKLAETFSRQPTPSIPAACGGWGDTRGAYRFFAHEDIDWQDILKPHWQASAQRMAEHPVVLCLQDTTELDFNGQGIAGLGRLSYDAQRGMYLHPTYAITPDREPLGVIDAWMWARSAKKGQAASDEVLESTRWIEGYERIAEQAASLPGTRLVYVADRESDLLALMRRAAELGHPADWLVRAKHNRVLPEDGKLWATVTSGHPLGQIVFTHAPRGQRARRVHQTVWAKSVRLAQGVTVTCVIAREEHPPSGVKPIEWRLLSNRPAGDLQAATQLIEWYRARWEIELFFHVVKNGCRIEALQLSRIERLERAIALYLVIAWRLARLMRLGRNGPDLPAELFFEPDEWRGVHFLLKKPIPKQAPRLNTVIRMVATLGGFLGRKCDGEPGVKTLWIGMQRVADFAAGLDYAREIQAL